MRSERVASSDDGRSVSPAEASRDLALPRLLTLPEVAAFLSVSPKSVRRLIAYTPAGGARRTAVASPAEGMGLATAISAALRRDTRRFDGHLHLFQASPLPLAIMLGHLWNRMPPTQLYDDLGPSKGYTPTFVV